MAEEAAPLAVAFRDPEDAAPAQLQDLRRAVDVLAFGGREEGGIELGSERIFLDAQLCLDREPHRAIGGRHQRRAVDDAARTLERVPSSNTPAGSPSI